MTTEPNQLPESVTFVLPKYEETLGGFSCAREWADEKQFVCGCPKCLYGIGLTLVYHVKDFNLTGERKGHWRVRVVSRAVGRAAPQMLVEGYE